MEPTNIAPSSAAQPPVPPSEPGHTKQSLNINRLLALVAGILLLVIGGIFMWSNSQQKNYQAAATAYEKQVTKTFTAISGNPQDTKELIAYLERHEAALGETAADVPSQPRLNAAKDIATRVSALANATKNLKSAMQNYRLFLVYRDGVLEAVKNSGGTISTIDQLRETKTRLADAQKEIKALKPPTGLEAHHKKQIALYDAPIQTMETAIAAYDKGNTDIYTDKTAQLAEEVKAISLPKTAEELLDMHQYYDAMTKAYTALEKLLK